VAKAEVNATDCTTSQRIISKMAQVMVPSRFGWAATVSWRVQGISFAASNSGGRTGVF